VGSQVVKRGGPSVGRIGFGGGCHWCTEAIFESLRGVQRVQQGFACSHPPAEQYSEAVLVDFDNECLPLEEPKISLLNQRYRPFLKAKL